MPTTPHQKLRIPGSAPTGGFDAALATAWAPLVRYLRAIAPSEADVEDLAARSVEIAWRRRDQLDDDDAVVPWLLGIATNVARNGRRGATRRARLTARLRGLGGEPSEHPPAHEQLLRGEPGPATRALATLSLADREVLVLHAWEELDHDAIGRVLGISRDAASQRVSRARRRLARAFETTSDQGDHA